MIRQVCQRPLASDNSLDKESKHCKHGKASVLEFLDLEVSKGIGVVSKSQGVKGTTGVEAIHTLRPLETATVVTVSLDSTHEDVLDDQSSNDGVSVDNSGDSKVLDTFIREDLGTSVEPLDVAGVGGPLGDDATESTKHSPAGVDDLDFTVFGKSLRVSRETSGIPAVVTGEFAIEVRDVGGEGSKELGAVGAVPGER